MGSSRQVTARQTLQPWLRVGRQPSCAGREARKLTTTRLWSRMSAARRRASHVIEEILGLLARWHLGDAHVGLIWRVLPLLEHLVNLGWDGLAAR